MMLLLLAVRILSICNSTKSSCESQSVLDIKNVCYFFLSLNLVGIFQELMGISKEGS